ncbi:MAG: M1 family aminopeptidase [Parabacteroides sp.]|nr:M1 family aminopeptidase [Parabacteroides sp.]
MKWLSLLCCLVILVSCASPSFEAGSELMAPGVSRGLAGLRKKEYTQLHYRLRFCIPENKNEAVTGSAELTFTLAKKQPVVLDFRGDAGQLEKITVNGAEVPVESVNEHILLPAAATKKGGNAVTIVFTASDQSLNRWADFLYTLLVPDRARTLFPCFDQPDMKAVFTLSLDIPVTWEAVANGRVKHTDMLSEAGRKKISFQPTEPLSTYLFAFTAGKYARETFTEGNRTISIYHRETDVKKTAQCPEIAAEVFRALAWQEEYTGIPYPFAKYDVAIIPGFQFGGMEHTGATFYTDRRMFLDEHPTLNERLARSVLIAHETSHMWFGDYVTMRWFDDVWTKEVFANYFASKIVKPTYPEVDHTLNFMLDYVPAAYSEDRTAGAAPIKQPLDNLRDAGLVYSKIVYCKSPVVMAQLEEQMGEAAFRKGIQAYLHTFAYGNATWDQLIAILDRYTDADLKAWSRAWVEGKGIPVYMAVRQGNKALLQAAASGYGAQRIGVLAITDKGEQIPLDVRTEGNGTVFGLPGGTVACIYNADGAAYGCFVPDTASALFYADSLACFDEVTRGAILVNRYELALAKKEDALPYLQSLLAWLPCESNPLLFNQALSYINGLARYCADAQSEIARVLWTVTETHPVQACRLQAFRLYTRFAADPDAVSRLYRIWEGGDAPGGCSLSETDRMDLSYILALRLPARADEIVSAQLARLANPDRKEQYRFISPAVSPRKSVRDSVFAALLLPENRRVEPWASAALAWLNHPLRQQEALPYIRPALEKVEEVQRTGDIFFPTAWANALLAGHTSPEAREAVEAFFREHPGYPVMLGNKIRQQADHLYRLE